MYPSVLFGTKNLSFWNESLKSDTPPNRYLSLKFGAVAVLPLLIIIGLAIYFLAPQLKRQTDIQHESMARAVAGQISAHLLGGERQLFALSTFLETQREWSSSQVTPLLDAQCGMGDLFETIYISSTRKQRIDYIGLAEKAHGGGRLKRDDLLGLDLSGRQFIFLAEKIKKSSWSETFLSTVSSRFAVALTVPVQGDHTIIGEITLNRLSELISHLSVEENILTIVLDRNGRIVADSQRTRWGQQLDLASLPPEKSGQETTFSSIPFEMDGNKMLGTMVKVRHLNWNVLVAQPVKTAYNPLTATFITLTSGLAFALALALAVAWLQAKKLSNTFVKYANEKQQIQNDLLGAKQAAEAANRAKSQFLANMSHDLRTPLNGIIGMLQLLDQTPVTSEQKEYVQVALKSSQRLTELLADILDLSRVEEGKMPLRHEQFDLLRTINQVCDLFRITFKQMGVALHSSIHPSIPRMMLGDVARLHQILNNLVGNAAKFTKIGSVDLEVYPLPAVQSGRYRVLFTLTDTGIGIAPHDIDHLFQPFRQVGDDWEQNAQGVGLGLAICKRLVKLMDGDIFVESEPGVGTTISFCVSFGECKSPPIKLAIPNPDILSESANINILVAEDEHINAITVKWMLEKIGCTAMIVENGAEALHALNKHHFHGVFMDIQMPVMNGLEAVQAIRQGKAGREKANIPVIALTAYSMKGDQERFLNQGMDGYISKPVELKQLKAVLQQLADRM